MTRMKTDRRFTTDRTGVSAVEFALVLPLLLSLFFGGYVVADAVTIRRKLTLTSRALADLTTQVSALSTNDMGTLLATSSQIIAPYDSAQLNIRLSEISTDATGLVATVTWSTVKGNTAKPYICNQSYQLPAGMNSPNSSYILSEVFYNFNPKVGYGITGTLILTDHMWMVPRISQSVGYTCPG